MSAPLIVAVYHMEQAYGGPEEGGWWYDTGQLARIVRIFRNEDKAYEFCRRLNHKLSSRLIGPNQGRREYTSVLSDGVYRAQVWVDNPPQYFPEERPHYE